MKAAKQYREVAVGETFNMAGFFWTVVGIAPNGRKFWAETPRDGRGPMRREFSSEFSTDVYYGEPDRDDDDGGD